MAPATPCTNSAEVAARSGCPPVPPLLNYYSEPGERESFVIRLFDDTAAEYDRVERWVSLGTGAWYRRAALRRAGLREGMRVLDVATGTGLVAREAGRIVGPGGSVVGVDPSREMRRRAEAGAGIATLEGTAESLPVADATADFVTMGYALRHVADLHAAFSELRRALRPGGRLCILEITRPATRLGRFVLRGHLTWLPVLAGRRSARTPELWRYYWDTIDRCVPPAVTLGALAAAGFRDVRHTAVLGIFSEFTGVRGGPAAE